MTLVDYYLADPRLILIPIEHLAPSGMSRELAAVLAERPGWSAAHGELFDRAFALYWKRSAGLAQRARTWMSPRIRHAAVVTDPAAVRPYVQLLNTSAWLLYAGDFDPERSHPEFGAYLFAHGDRLALSGEITLTALHNAAWWLERTDDECAAFVAAADRSTRPDAAGYQAIARALPWLRKLRHETIDPPLIVSPHRAIPGTGLLVPQALDHEPRPLVDAWAVAARHAVDAYTATWRTPATGAIAELTTWLASDEPPVLVMAAGGRIVWDPERPKRTEELRATLEGADATAVASIADDLRTIVRHTRAFLAALVAPDGLPMPEPDTEQRGYSYMHRDRRLIAYALDEPGMERLCGPGLPYARMMLGARTVHEWAHLAVDAGWVPCAVAARERDDRHHRLAEAFDGMLAALPSAIRSLTARDLADIGAGEGLARLFVARMPDYQANLLAQRFLDRGEIETYIRHNVRTLRFTYPPAQLLRMVVRYLFELQYLRFSAVDDRSTFFVRSTWFDADVLANGVLDGTRFSELARAGGAVCACYAVDEGRFTRRAGE